MPSSVAAGRRRVWWAVPLLTMLAATAGCAAWRHQDTASNRSLPARSPQQLATAITTATAKVGFSGTVVANSELSLPTATDALGLSVFASVGLIAGSHTAKVWSAGRDRQRVALVDSSGEIDYFRDGARYWRWDPMRRTAVHLEVPDTAAQDGWTPIPRVLPTQLATWAVGAIQDTTRVSVGPTGHVAGRPCYQLRVQPNDSGSLISVVTISVDASSSLPLAVQVYSRSRTVGSTTAVLSTAFTHVHLGRPDAANFGFSPPPGASTAPSATATLRPDAGAAEPGAQAAADVQVVAHGTGWERVIELAGPAQTFGTSSVSTATALGQLRVVSGDWGRGRLYTSALLSLLVTDDGHTFVGSVPPARLYTCA